MKTLGRECPALPMLLRSTFSLVCHAHWHFLLLLNRWIRASFLQDFSVSGGPNGRMKRGEEIVQICVQGNENDRSIAATLASGITNMSLDNALG